jgi:crotonobetainyl-CoA:carnitine CoA-transferase CaiB-like acyl-CoA transferase
MTGAAPLAGYRIVECGDYISAPYATRLLADLGADVVKVEPAEGDSARRHGPFPGEPDGEESGLFHAINFNKRSVVLDLDSPAGRERLEALLATSAAFVSNLPAEQRAALGLGLEAVVERHPSLVAVAVTPFGDTGPYTGMPGCSLTSSALGGASWVIGHPGRPPLTLPVDMADYEGGANAAAAALVGILGVVRGGRGQGIDIAVAELIAAFVGVNTRMYLPYGKRWARAGRSASDSGGSFPYLILPCRDGYVALIGRGQRDWENILAAMGQPAWAEEERFRDPYRVARENAPEAAAHLAEWSAARTRDDLLAIARRHGFALAPVRSTAEILTEPQFLHRQVFVDAIDVGGRSFTPPGPSYALSDWRAPRSVKRAPRLGEHTTEVLGSAVR